MDDVEIVIDIDDTSAHAGCREYLQVSEEDVAKFEYIEDKNRRKYAGNIITTLS